MADADKSLFQTIESNLTVLEQKVPSTLEEVSRLRAEKQELLAKFGKFSVDMGKAVDMLKQYKAKFGPLPK